MKTNKKQLLTALVLGVVVVILFFGGCKKDLTSDSNNLKKPDLLMSSEGGTGKAKVLRQSPGLKVEMKSKSTNRVYPTLQGIDELTALLNGLNKKKKAEVITTSYATFSATPYGSWYSCIVDFLDPTGNKDFYLVNENTWVFTYIGSSSEAYATFAVNKPSMYGSYRIWIEGGNGNQFSNALYLGDLYTGVSLVGGVLEFTNKSALNVILARLDQAHENHASNFVDPLDYMTEDQISDYAISVGFDEYLPMKEFEAYFGLYSLRQKIEYEEATWLALADPWSAAVYPDDNYAIDDDAERTVNNQYSQVKVAGNLIEPVSTIEGPTSEVGCSVEPGSGFCDDKRKVADNIPLPNNKMIRWKITKKAGASGNDVETGGSTMWFNSYVKAKLRRFRSQNGIWTKRMAKMSVQIVGKVYRSDGYNFCGPALLYDTFNLTSSYERGYMEKKKIDWNAHTYVQSCEVYANFNVEGFTFTKYLQ